MFVFSVGVMVLVASARAFLTFDFDLLRLFGYYLWFRLAVDCGFVARNLLSVLAFGCDLVVLWFCFLAGLDFGYFRFWTCVCVVGLFVF